MENLTFNDLPKAMELLLNQVASMKSEITQLRQQLQQQLQQTKPDENLILGTWHEWEIIYTSDERLKNFGIKRSQVQHWKEIGLPFHYTASGGKLYTTPRELEAYLNPYHEALKNLKKTIL